MALLDELRGLLSPEEFAKIQGNPKVASRIARGDEYVTYYDGDETPAATPPAAVTPPAAATPPSQFDLGSFEQMLDKRLGKINEIVETRVNDVVKARGDELVSNAVKISLQRADELNRIYSRHAAETGKPFDSTDFNTFLEKPESKARGYRTITQAYEDYVAPQTQERTIAAEVDKRLKAESGRHVPGTTPAPSVNSNIRVFMKRGSGGDGAPSTSVQKAAEALDRRMIRQQEMAS